MTKYFLFIGTTLILNSCQSEQKFDKAKWAEVADLMTFPNRKYMINDLIKNYQLKGKTYNEIIEFLGQPQSGMDFDHEVYYDIDVDYGSDIDPIYTKTLTLGFSKDSITQKVVVQVWKK